MNQGVQAYYRNAKAQKIRRKVILAGASWTSSVDT